MVKKNKEVNEEFEYINTELEKLHPEKGDIFILNINTDDPDILYSDEILDSVDRLDEVLEDMVGFRIPILVFGNEMDLTLLSKDEISYMIVKLQEMLEYAEETEEDTENLTELFS